MAAVFDFAAILKQLDKRSVFRISQKIFGIPYSELAKIIYPQPQYKYFLLSKRSGGHRTIGEPRLPLKKLQHKLLEWLYENSGPMKSCVHGFVKGRSVVSNAKKHASPKTKFVLNVDIEDFFPSITFYRVRGLFESRPFEFSRDVATVLAQVCCVNGKLPQGAPTSPIVANLICRSLDKQLMELAHRNRATYSRYCDDLTFSFTVRSKDNLPGGVCAFDGSVLTIGAELISIVSSCGFQLNPKKSRISSSLHRMEVTGLVVNQFPNVRREFVDQIRGALHAWERYGYGAAEAKWRERPYGRQLRTGYVPMLHRVIWGRLLYLRMVRNADDFLYSRLAEKYNKLVCTTKQLDGKFEGQLLPISSVVRNPTEAASAIFVIECVADHPEFQEVVYRQGTAFSVRDSGLLTCDHVLRFVAPDTPQAKSWMATNPSPYIDSVEGAKIEIVNTLTAERRPVKVLHRDPDRDLALLTWDGPPPIGIRHFSLLDTPPERNQSVRLLGFPNWSPARKHPNDLSCQVTNAFFRSGLKRLEVSVPVREGNSGGPCVDAHYRVAGIAQLRADTSSGNDECLCVSEISKWMSSLPP